MPTGSKGVSLSTENSARAGGSVRQQQQSTQSKQELKTRKRHPNPPAKEANTYITNGVNRRENSSGSSESGKTHVCSIKC